ncbi:hypothetical protein GBAR_LOCUS12848, partial [Geodia barretti]
MRPGKQPRRMSDTIYLNVKHKSGISPFAPIIQDASKPDHRRKR